MEPRIWTFSCKSVNPTDLKPDDIRDVDIAHALACCNRFAGHASQPISVAQHSVWTAKLTRKYGNMVALQALLHDASEAYLGDVTKWLKGSPSMAAYREAEDRVQRQIYRKFGVSEEDLPEVKAVDKLLVRYEMLQGFGNEYQVAVLNTAVKDDYPPLTPDELALFIPWRFWSWREAKGNFLNLLEELTCT